MAIPIRVAMLIAMLVFGAAAAAVVVSFYVGAEGDARATALRVGKSQLDVAEVDVENRMETSAERIKGIAAGLVLHSHEIVNNYSRNVQQFLTERMQTELAGTLVEKNPNSGWGFAVYHDNSTFEYYAIYYDLINKYQDKEYVIARSNQTHVNYVNFEHHYDNMTIGEAPYHSDQIAAYRDYYRDLESGRTPYMLWQSSTGDVYQYGSQMIKQRCESLGATIYFISWNTVLDLSLISTAGDLLLYEISSGEMLAASHPKVASDWQEYVGGLHHLNNRLAQGTYHPEPLISQISRRVFKRRGRSAPTNAGYDSPSAGPGELQVITDMPSPNPQHPGSRDYFFYWSSFPELGVVIVWYQWEHDYTHDVQDKNRDISLIVGLSLLAVCSIIMGVTYVTVVIPLRHLKDQMVALARLDIKKVNHLCKDNQRTYSVSEIDALYTKFNYVRATVKECIPFLPQMHAPESDDDDEEEDDIMAATQNHEMTEEDLEDIEYNLEDDTDLMTSIAMGTTISSVAASQKPNHNVLSGAFGGMQQSGEFGDGESPALTPSNSLGRVHPPPSPSESLRSDGSNKGPRPGMVKRSHSFMFPAGAGSPVAAQGELNKHDVIVASFSIHSDLRFACLEHGQWRELTLAIQHVIAKSASETKGQLVVVGSTNLVVVWAPPVVQQAQKAVECAHLVHSRLRDKLNAMFPSKSSLLAVGISHGPALVGVAGTVKKSYICEGEVVTLSTLYAGVARTLHCPIVTSDKVAMDSKMISASRPVEAIKLPAHKCVVRDRAEDTVVLYQSVCMRKTDADEWMYMLEQQEKADEAQLEDLAFDALRKGDLNLYRLTMAKCLLEQPNDPYVKGRNSIFDLSAVSPVSPVSPSAGGKLESSANSPPLNANETEVFPFNVSSDSTSVIDISTSGLDPVLITYFKAVAGGEVEYGRNVQFAEASALPYEHPNCEIASSQKNI